MISHMCDGYHFRLLSSFSLKQLITQIEIVKWVLKYSIGI